MSHPLANFVSARAKTFVTPRAEKSAAAAPHGLPPGEFPTPIFDVVLKRITVRGSIVGTRRDLDEAIAFAVEGKVRSEITKAPLADINAIFDRMKSGKIDGRMVLEMG